MISIEEPKQEPLGVLWWMIFGVAVLFALLVVGFFVVDIAGFGMPDAVKNGVSLIGKYLRAI
ncbi:MAG: hypothetical protein PHE61_01260 [Candidatus Omnitrophica bacterium]|nr:hypothetical protein [Candidatus Omnitrophota bacterium]